MRGAAALALLLGACLACGGAQEAEPAAALQSHAGHAMPVAPGASPPAPGASLPGMAEVEIPFERPRGLALKRDARFLAIEEKIWQMVEEAPDRIGMTKVAG